MRACVCVILWCVCGVWAWLRNMRVWFGGMLYVCPRDVCVRVWYACALTLGDGIVCVCVCVCVCVFVTCVCMVGRSACVVVRYACVLVRCACVGCEVRVRYACLTRDAGVPGDGGEEGRAEAPGAAPRPLEERRRRQRVDEWVHGGVQGQHEHRHPREHLQAVCVCV